MKKWFSETFNKYIIKPFQDQRIETIKLPISENPRLNSYIDYSINDGIIRYIEVNQTRLMFRAFDQNETVQTLQDQFKKIHKKDLVLENEEVTISPTMPLDQIITSNQDRKAFQEIVVRLQRKQMIQVADMPAQQREIIHQVVQKCREYHTYHCKVLMKNGLEEPLKVEAPITGETTFQDLITGLNTHPLVIGQDIEFLSSEGKLFDQAIYKEPFQALGIHQPILYARYSYHNSLMRGNTMISVRTQDLIQLPVMRLDQGKVEIVSYNSIERKVERNKLSNFRKLRVQQFFRITLTLKLQEEKSDEKPVFLEVTGSLRVFVITEDFDEIWLPVQKLVKGKQVGGLHPRKNAFAIYQVQDIEKISLQQDEDFYGVEVLPAHQIIGNRIIIHNCDAFTIIAKYLGANPREEEVRFYRNELISKHFEDRVVMVGGMKLNNRQTFGDYQLDQFKVIYVLQQEAQVKAHREHVISEWRSDSIDLDKAKPSKLQTFNRKLQQEYFGIYQQRIVNSRQIEQLCKNKPKEVVNVLVALRMHFERINYYLNKESRYIKDQKQVFDRQMEVLRSQKEEQLLKKALAEGKQNKLSVSDVMAIFCYTSNRFYKDLNAFLRDQYVLDCPEFEQKWLPLTGWVARATQRATSFRGTTYRAVGKIDLRKALNFDKLHPQASQFNDKFIVFTNFTSTSQDKQATENFLSKDAGSANSLLTLKVNKGYQIDKYSYYASEKQVLILPFTYFLITEHNLASSPQTATLEQIPIPCTTLPNLIFWVDDQPQKNDKIVEYFQNRGIEVVQVTSTRVMKVILQNFFWIQKMIGRKVVIISDMVRQEGQKTNYTAGVDLFELIYNDYGLSNKAIIFCSDKQKAQQNLRDRGIYDGNWVLITEGQQIIEEVLNEFTRL